ncbi:MAG: Hint domain-containing protein, partial [Patescibacteria group bacterium]
FYAGGSDRVVITTAGNVGVGNSSPTGLLHVSSSALYVSSTSGNVGIGTTSPAKNLVLTGNSPTFRIDDTGGVNTWYDFMTGSGAAGDLAIKNVNGTAITILSNRNVGIGTTNPTSTLTVAGEIKTTTGGVRFPDNTLQNTAYLGGTQTIVAGNVAAGIFGSNTGFANYSFGASTTAGFPILHIDEINDRVGIGTTAPSQKLHVEGQCVTGDTLLPILTENSKLQFKTQNIQIKNIKGGEYVLSLDEKTGKIVPAKIKGLLDMGVRPVFRLTTANGKTIRTTGNHPYLINKKSAFPADSLEPQNGSINSVLTANNMLTSQVVLSSASGDNFLSRGFAGDRTPKTLLSRQSLNHSEPTAISFYQEKLKQAKWTKVIYLEEGDEIAVPDENLEFVEFVKISRIAKLPPEQVYDIEVEGTHNFIGNGILAHNTYLNGNVGVGNSSP